MKDAFGGVLNLVLIALFLVIVSGVLGLTVSYTKAFNFKNYVISSIENYEGSKGCFDVNGACFKKIKDKADRIGYAPVVGISCHGNTSVGNLFCYSQEPADPTPEPVKYKITTQIDLNIPIISKIAGFSAFQVSGDTRLIKRKG